MTAAPVVVVGVGQMGATFAHGFLRLGRAVHPVRRGDDPAEVAARVPEPELVLVAVGEGELDGVLRTLPEAWRDRVALLQNELLPVDWAELADPSVAVVWFERKRDKPLHVILPTAVAGPRRGLLLDALAALDIAHEALEDEEALLHALVRKNLYILTSNIAGLEVGGTVGQLWAEHHDLASDVASEVTALQAWRAGVTLPHRQLVDAMAEAFAADPTHGCRGRSAPGRLARALGHAREAELAVPTLSRIAAAHSVAPPA